MLKTINANLPRATQRFRAGLAASMMTGALLVAGALPAQDYTFQTVKVEGNTNVDAASILKFAGLQKGQTISGAALNDAYQRITASGLFETVELVPKGGVLLIRVVELPIINVIDFEGNKRLKDAKLTEIIASKSRHVYSAATAEADAAAIADAYTAQGRLAASVTPKLIRRDTGRVDLVFEIAEGNVVENEAIAFVGNRGFSDGRLRQVLKTKQAGFFRQLIKADTFNPDRLELDKQVLRDFYLSRGYIDVQVGDAVGELTRERDATYVTYNVTEGQVYSIGKVSMISEISGLNEAEYSGALRLKPGATYSPALIERNIARLEALVQRDGLNFVQVEPRLTRNPETQTLDVDFVVKRGERVFVERIDIEGNTTTLDQVVRRQFQSSEGDPFSPRDIRQAAERIRALGFFEGADVKAEPGSAPDQVVVNVDLSEAKTGSVSFGLTFGTSNGAGGSLGYSETNFLGRGQGLNLTLSATTDTKDFNLAFVEPSLMGRDVKLKFNAAYSATVAASAKYNTQTGNFSPALEFPVGEQSRLELRYKLANDQVINNGSTSSVIIDEDARGRELMSAIGYSYTFDTRKTGVNPLGGVLLRFGQDFAGVGGDVKYIATNALALAETKVIKDQVALRAIFEGGVIAAQGGYETRVTDRFFGAGKIRGFERNGIGPREAGDALGGNIYATMRFEADFPLGLPEEYGISGGAFFDMGSVWGLDKVGSAVGSDFALRSAAGLSIFWATPIGPLRLNFSRALEKESYDLDRNFELTISTTF